MEMTIPIKVDRRTQSKPLASFARTYNSLAASGLQDE